MKQKNYYRPVFQLGMMILLGLALSIIGFINIRPVWDSGIVNQITLVIMLISLVYWIILWIIFDAFESEEFGNLLSDYTTKQQKLGAFVLAVIIPLSFLAMVINIVNVPVFISIMGAVVLGTSIGDHFVIKNIVRDIEVQIHLSNSDPKLLEYYTNHPHMLLHCIQLFLIAVAAAAYLFIIHTREPGFEWIVYIILSVSILINESIFWKWRRERIRQ